MCCLWWRFQKYFTLLRYVVHSKTCISPFTFALDLFPSKIWYFPSSLQVVILSHKLFVPSVVCTSWNRWDFHTSFILSYFHTFIILKATNMLSINQRNAQIKIMEIWKASNVSDYPLKLNRKEIVPGNINTRACTQGRLIVPGTKQIIVSQTRLVPKESLLTRQELNLCYYSFIWWIRWHVWMSEQVFIL